MTTTSRIPASRPCLPRGARSAHPHPHPRHADISAVRAGIDTVLVERFERLLLLRGAALTGRVFTPHEIATCAGSPARLAARLAAKEAAAKALGTGIGLVAWRDLEVRTDDDGAPALVLHGPAAGLARRRGLTDWSVSLTHTGGHAVAVVVATGGPSS